MVNIYEKRYLIYLCFFCRILVLGIYWLRIRFSFGWVGYYVRYRRLFREVWEEEMESFFFYCFVCVESLSFL